MGILHPFQPEDKIIKDGDAILCQSSNCNIHWFLATHPDQTFTSEDIVDTIMEAGMMIHEKEFIHLLTSNFCRKTGLPFVQKSSTEDRQPRNKFL